LLASFILSVGGPLFTLLLLLRIADGERWQIWRAGIGQLAGRF
jgi:hypothetical protein